MPAYKFQVPANSKQLRGQLFIDLYRNYDTITIERPEEIQLNRFLAFSRPLMIGCLMQYPKIDALIFSYDNGYIGNPDINSRIL